MRKTLPPCLEPPAEGAWAPPLDVQDVVVRLEAAGITDSVARREYQSASLWTLAESCFSSQDYPDRKRKTKRRSLLAEYLEGVAFAMPLLLCAIAMMMLGYSLWGGDVEAPMAAATGLGTVSSFIATGGFIQLLARRVLFQLNANKSAVPAIFRRWLFYSVAFLVFSGLAMVALARPYQWLPPPYDLAALAFHLTLGLFWIAAGTLQMLERVRWTVAATVIGIAAVVLLHRGFGIPLAAAQFFGIMTALLTAFGACALEVRRVIRKAAPTAPASAANDLYYGWPFLLYGGCYYAFVFADRLLCWSVPTPGAPSSLLFRGDYETALDLALIAFVLQAGLLPIFNRNYFHRLDTMQQQLPAHRHNDFLAGMNLYYLKLGGTLLAFTGCIAALVCAAVWNLPPMQGHLMHRTLVLAAIGNSVFVAALWNANLLFRLSRPLDVLTPIALALGASVTVGYLASRWGVYQDSILGFVAGAVLFLLLTFEKLLAASRSLAHYYFAADA